MGISKIGWQIIARALELTGTEVVFGLLFEKDVPVYEELHRSDIRCVLMRHGQGVVHAADGYARATGKTGVCLLNSFLGTVNAITGIATAYRDSIPLVILISDVFSGRENDIANMTSPCTKHTFVVREINRFPEILRVAFWMASSARPGPVIVVIPEKILKEKAEFFWPEEIQVPWKIVYTPDLSSVKRAFELIETSHRPVMLVGGGAISSGASPEILSFAERLHLPVATTLLGIGAFPATHSQYLGMPGVFGNYYANMSLSHSDLIISVGARFNNRVTARADLFAPKARLIHIDIDPSSIGRTIRTDVPIVGDCRQALRQFLKIIEQKAQPLKYWQERFREWWEQIEAWKREHPLRYPQDRERVKPQFVIEKICELTGGKAIIATEVGQNQLWTAHFYKFNRPRSFITSGGLGTMGFGFPAAIGAQIGRPRETVVDIAGDGSFQMTFKELATALDYRLPLKVVLFNNGHLGLVRQWQKIFHGGRCFAVQFHCPPNFVKLARAYGARALSIQKPAEVEPVLQEALQTEALTLVEVHISPDETVFPLVPFGKSLQEMVLGPPPSFTSS